MRLIMIILLGMILGFFIIPQTALAATPAKLEDNYMNCTASDLYLNEITNCTGNYDNTGGSTANFDVWLTDDYVYNITKNCGPADLKVTATYFGTPCDSVTDGKINCTGWETKDDGIPITWTLEACTYDVTNIIRTNASSNNGGSISLFKEDNISTRSSPVFGQYTFQEGGSYAGVDDTYISDGTSEEDINYENDSANIEVYQKSIAAGGEPQNKRGLIQFDLTSLSSQTNITSVNVSLYLYSFSGTGTGMSVHRITNSSIVNETTWKNRTASILWGSTGGDYASTATDTTTVALSEGWYDWDIMNDVEGWMNGTYSNYGSIFIPPAVLGTYQRNFRDDRNSTYGPRLLLNFTIKNQTWTWGKNNTNINLSKFFFDGDSNDLNFTSSSSANITVYINNNTGQATLGPDPGWRGTGWVIFNATDGQNWTASNNVSLTVTSCLYGGLKWNIDCTENCNIQSDVSLGDNDLNFLGNTLGDPGIVTLNANVTRIASWSIGDVCKVIITSGNRFEVSGSDVEE